MNELANQRNEPLGEALSPIYLDALAYPAGCAMSKPCLIKSHYRPEQLRSE